MQFAVMKTIKNYLETDEWEKRQGRALKLEWSERFELCLKKENTRKESFFQNVYG